RRTGRDRPGVDSFVSSRAALIELAPDYDVETLYILASERHGELAMVRGHGRLVASGGETEHVYLRLSVHRDGRLVEMDLFEPTEREAALAHLDQLRDDRIRIPP